MMASSPQVSDRPVVDFIVYDGNDGGPTLDMSANIIEMTWSAVTNSGYVISVTINDAGFHVLRTFLIQQGYFSTARQKPVFAKARLTWAGIGNTTGWRSVIITNLHSMTKVSGTIAKNRFTGIDPPSWYLNRGNASGKVYNGRVSDALKSCIMDYVPNTITVNVTETTDSNHNKWWMMRQDPSTFIASILEWSCALTPNRGQWVVISNEDSISIREQLSIASNNVGLYNGPGGAGAHITNWEMLADNALSISMTKLVTQGASAVTGQYFDRITDAGESQVFVGDSTTQNKYKANTTASKTFTKPTDDQVGWTSIAGIPEIYSGGELGLTYDKYVDGRARQLYLNMLNYVHRVRFQVYGHGIYNDSTGLGTDTITVSWFDVDGQSYFLAGNWIIYGYSHKFKLGKWMTNLYCARIDWDSLAIAKP